ncbi:hypothetical protein [Streptosporangium sp. NPDC002607]
MTRAACGAQPDTAAVNRLTEQVETLRNLVSALLRSTQALGVSLIAALAGLLVLSRWPPPSSPDPCSWRWRCSPGCCVCS